MQTLNKVHPTAATVLDMRRGDNTQHGVAVLTPWGQFRSLAVCVDHVMTREGEFAAPFIVRAATCGWGDDDIAAVIKRARKNLYATLYARCRVGTETSNGQFRFI